jgi:hypothetical protein
VGEHSFEMLGRVQIVAKSFPFAKINCILQTSKDGKGREHQKKRKYERQTRLRRTRTRDENTPEGRDF